MIFLLAASLPGAVVGECLPIAAAHRLDLRTGLMNSDARPGQISPVAATRQQIAPEPGIAGEPGDGAALLPLADGLRVDAGEDEKCNGCRAAESHFSDHQLLQLRLRRTLTIVEAGPPY